MAVELLTPTRRGMLVSVGAVAIAALPVPQTKAAPLGHNDAAIEADWQETVTCRRGLDAVDWEGPAYGWLCDRLDAAENRIRSREVSTRHGAAIKLWLALLHMVDNTVESRAAEDRDMAAMERHDENLDWNARCVVAALRALNSQREV